MAKKTSSNRKKKKTEATLGAALFYGIFFGLIGAFVGFVFVASFGPSQVPDEVTLNERLNEDAERTPRPGRVYFLRPPAGQPGWEAKRAALLEGSSPTVVFSPEELNGWIQGNFQVTQTQDTPSGIGLAPRRAAFATFADGRVQVTIFCDFFIFGARRDLVVIADGLMEEGSADLFALQSLRFNSAEIPPIPFMRQFITSRVLSAFRSAEEYGRALEMRNRIQSAAVRDRQIHFTVR